MWFLAGSTSCYGFGIWWFGVWKDENWSSNKRIEHHNNQENFEMFRPGKGHVADLWVVDAFGFGMKVYDWMFFRAFEDTKDRNNHGTWSNTTVVALRGFSKKLVHKFFSPTLSGACRTQLEDGNTRYSEHNHSTNNSGACWWTDSFATSLMDSQELTRFNSLTKVIVATLKALIWQFVFAHRCVHKYSTKFKTLKFNEMDKCSESSDHTTWLWCFGLVEFFLMVFFVSCCFKVAGYFACQFFFTNACHRNLTVTVVDKPVDEGESTQNRYCTGGL